MRAHSKNLLRLEVAAVLLATALLLLLVSTMDYEDEVRAAKDYQEKVCSGTYPDYKGISPECGVPAK